MIYLKYALKWGGHCLKSSPKTRVFNLKVMTQSQPNLIQFYVCKFKPEFLHAVAMIPTSVLSLNESLSSRDPRPRLQPLTCRLMVVCLCPYFSIAAWHGGSDSSPTRRTTAEQDEVTRSEYKTRTRRSPLSANHPDPLGPSVSSDHVNESIISAVTLLKIEATWEGPAAGSVLTHSFHCTHNAQNLR